MTKTTTIWTRREAGQVREGEGVQTASWVETVFDAWERVESERIPPFELLTDCPDWVANVVFELTKEVYPAAKLKKGFVLGAASLGALLGRQYALQALFLGEIPLPPEVQRECGALADQVRLTREQRERVENCMNDLATRSKDAFSGVLTSAFSLAWKQPHDEAMTFVTAFKKAAVIDPDELVTEYWMRQRTRILFVLLAIWPGIQRMSTIAELHRCLQGASRGWRIVTLKSFEKVCQKVGLRLGRRGRPRKALIQKS
jgi:hypothetical protein